MCFTKDLSHDSDILFWNMAFPSICTLLLENHEELSYNPNVFFVAKDEGNMCWSGEVLGRNKDGLLGRRVSHL